MASYIVLLRGINVGGANKLPMASLREALTHSGFDGVRTYIQSGNIVVEAAGRTTDRSVADGVAEVIQSEFGLTIPTVALNATSFAKVVKANPFVDEPDPRLVHVLFLMNAKASGVGSKLDAVVASAKAKKDAGEEARLIGRAIYLHTPRGFGDSELAKALSGKRIGIEATARNWRTVLTLLSMLQPEG